MAHQKLFSVIILTIALVTFSHGFPQSAPIQPSNSNNSAPAENDQKSSVVVPQPSIVGIEADDKHSPKKSTGKTDSSAPPASVASIETEGHEHDPNSTKGRDDGAHKHSIADDASSLASDAPPLAATSTNSSLHHQNSTKKSSSNEGLPSGKAHDKLSSPGEQGISGEASNHSVTSVMDHEPHHEQVSDQKVNTLSEQKGKPEEVSSSASNNSLASIGSHAVDTVVGGHGGANGQMDSGTQGPPTTNGAKNTAINVGGLIAIILLVVASMF